MNKDMKKIYIQPASSLVAVKATNTILAGSLKGGTMKGTTDEILSSGGEGDGTDIGAKGYTFYYDNSYWNQDEE